MDSIQSDNDADGDESSSLPTLDQFREKWQNELKSANQRVPSTASAPNHSTKCDSEAEALFKQGVELERAGEVFEAMQMYRRAVHLDPQIEFKMYDKTKAAIAAAHDRELAPAEQRHADDAHESDDNIDDLTTEELIARFAKAVQIGDAAHPVDDGVIRDNSVQLLSLPMEILVYILRWVVSSHLDLRSLEQCSMASKSLYLCTRQSEIWRLACQRVWRHKTGSLKTAGYISWRQMYIERPRVWLNGCYISRTTYFRYGERSFQDQFYRPVHLVKYYRYIRFYSDGAVIVMTSADEPANVVGKLHNSKHRHDLLRGHYTYIDDMITLFVRKNQAKGSHDDKSRDTTFGLQFVISYGRRKRTPQLEWKKYTIIQKDNKGEEMRSDFDLTPTVYPPLIFSRVKSYDAVSYQCL